MARKLAADFPQLAVPDAVVGRLERDPAAGVDDRLRARRGRSAASGAFDGVHLVVVNQAREVVRRLERLRP